MKNSTFVHKYTKSLINEKDIVVDMTCGNGNDTLFLCSLANKVYAFDVQQQAIINTKEKTKAFNNLVLIKDNHINVSKYVKEKVKLIIFNLGYLPHANSNIITLKDDTLSAIKSSYDLLVDNGYLVITFYLGHKGGKDEFYLVDNYIQTNRLNIIEKYQEKRKIDEPITYIIKK